MDDPTRNVSLGPDKIGAIFIWNTVHICSPCDEKRQVKVLCMASAAGRTPRTGVTRRSDIYNFRSVPFLHSMTRSLLEFSAVAYMVPKYSVGLKFQAFAQSGL